MPEGNTIHWLARAHNRDLAGQVVRVSSPQGRFAREARRLDRRRFLRAEAYGKHLFHHWEGDAVVHVHLGMAGWFYRYRGAAPRPRPSVRMRLAAPGVTVDLIGPPTCALGTAADRDAVVARLGPDPLDAASDSMRGFERLARRRTPSATRCWTSESPPESATSIAARRSSSPGSIRCGRANGSASRSGTRSGGSCASSCAGARGRGGSRRWTRARRLTPPRFADRATRSTSTSARSAAGAARRSRSSRCRAAGCGRVPWISRGNSDL